LGIIQSAWDPAALELPPVSIRVSVIVCAYNAIATLPACLDGIMALPFQKHPLCEVIVVDDGSTDATKEYLATWEGGFSAVPKRVVRLNGNGGLSAARNAGAAAARGDVLAFIDADCVPSLEWICELLRPFEANSATMIVGGPNLAPKSLATLPKAIAAAPGSPVEVLRTDEEADHLPGCNLACRATMFAELGGFDPLFRIAGDDVDFCWRARNAGAVLRFAPGAWVWHRRRETVAAWLRQQWHYGRAEGLLALKHPERFAGRLAPFWAGCIYDGSGSVAGPDARVAHGRFGTASFQAIYGAAESAAGLVPPYFAWAALVCAAVGIFAAKIAWALLWIALGLLVAPRAWSYAVERRVAIGSWPGALLSGLLAVLQPVCRASGRLHGWLFPGVSKGEPPSKGAGESGLLRFRVAGWDQRMPFLGKLAERLRQNVGICAEDAGSAPWDFRVTGGSGFVAEVVTAMRAVPQGVPELLVKITLKRRLVSVTLLTCAVLALGLATAAWGCVGIVIPVLWAWLDPIGTRRQFHMRIVDAVNHCAREIGAERASEAVGGGIHL
jgi:GT2 family glycosyltransferase